MHAKCMPSVKRLIIHKVATNLYKRKYTCRTGADNNYKPLAKEVDLWLHYTNYKLV